MKKYLKWIAVGTLTLALLAGCGGGDKPVSEGEKDETEVAEDVEKDNEKDEADESEDKEEGSGNYKDEIILGQSGKIISIDPQENSNTQHNYLFRMVFDTLLKFNNATQELEPRIATEWDTEDGQTYTFKLRDDVYFHNGEHLTADDVIYTFERAKDSSTSAQVGNMVDTMEAEDDYTLVMTLVEPHVDFPFMLTLPTTSIINEKAISEDEIEGPGVGTGVWKIDSYEIGDYFTLAANDEYWGDKANAKKFTMRYIQEHSPRVIALETGEIDICQDPPILELSHIEDTEGLRLDSYDGTSLQYLAMNYKKAPFDNADFRLAMAHGIDIDELAMVVYDDKVSEATTTFHPDQFGFNDKIEKYTYDPELAKEYVDKAFPDGGASFELSCSAGPRKEMAEILQAQMKEIGVEMSIKEMDTAGLSTSTTNGEHDAAFYGCGMNVFGDDSRRLLMPGTGVNKSHYDNERVNELIELAVEEMDEATRLDYYHEIQEIVHEEAGYVPLFFTTGFFGVKDGVGGIDYYPTSHHDFSYVYFEE